MSDTSSAIATPDTIEDLTTDTGGGFESRVTVYDCNCHTFKQVISLFCQMIPGMNAHRAFELAWHIHHKGSAVVFEGERKIAEDVAKKLVSGGLRVAVQ